MSLRQHPLALRLCLVLILCLPLVTPEAVPLSQAATGPKPTPVTATPAPPQTGGEYVPGQLIVRLRDGVHARLAQQGTLSTGLPTLDSLGASSGLQDIAPLFSGGSLAGQADTASIYRLQFPQGEDVKALAAAYAADPGVVYAEPNYIYHTTGAPNDPYFPQQ